MKIPANNQNLETFGDRIDNWRRAHRWHSAHGRALSLEGRHRPGPGHQWTEVPIPPPPTIDMLDAITLEMAWGTLNSKARWVLKLAVHGPINPHDDRMVGWACRKVRRECGLRVHVPDWGMHVYSAQQDLRDALATSERINAEAWRAMCQQIVDKLIPKVYGTADVALAD